MKNDLLNFASIFLLIWSTCSLESAIKESFSFLLYSNSIFIAGLRFYALIYGFPALVMPDFTTFFVFRYLPFFMSSRFVTLSLD